MSDRPPQYTWKKVKIPPEPITTETRVKQWNPGDKVQGSVISYRASLSSAGSDGCTPCSTIQIQSGPIRWIIRIESDQLRRLLDHCKPEHGTMLSIEYNPSTASSGDGFAVYVGEPLEKEFQEKMENREKPPNHIYR